MKLRLFLLNIFLLVFQVFLAQQFSFDSGVIEPFQATEPSKAQLTLVEAPYKDGNASLEWSWTAPTSILVDHAVNLRNFRDGVIFWVYNDIPKSTPLRGEFRDVNDNVRYYFDFGLDFKGWRICRIGSRYMLGNKSQSSNLKLYLKSPTGEDTGSLFIDRFSFASDVGHQNAPDAQQPQNNESIHIDHWNGLWKWESEFTYDLPLNEELSDKQLNSLEIIEQEMVKRLPRTANATAVSNSKFQFRKSGIKEIDNRWIGDPLVVLPDKETGDITLSDLGSMMYGFALDAVFNRNQASLKRYLELWDYAHDQGFTYGSAMGNNHHYGYETRQIFESAFLMRDALIESGQISEVVETLSFWSGLPETRRLYDQKRSGIVDAWNTLAFPRLISAILIQDLPERYRAIESLVRWVGTSLEYTPGNMGGIKPDGTIFHHAGHYPAYGIGALASLTHLIATLPDTEFNLSQKARASFANALFAMANYTHFHDWSIGMSGRHPHSGSISNLVIEAFGLLALLGNTENSDGGIDEKLASEYHRLETRNTELKQRLSAYTAAPTPSGFFVFNHAAAGVHRFDNSMVTIKGYNSDVWGSEIYTRDNRYGRYQSYGAVEIMNEGSPVSRQSSRFSEAGWDWNRLPGTTTIHLPLNLLESPITSTLMARSKEDFAGASSLQGKYGVFGMKLWEENLINNTNYTPDFKARKSVFSFDKRMVCIGTNITNSNRNYPTETTLFQQRIDNADERISVNGDFENALGFSFDGHSSSPLMVNDLSGNFYRIASDNRVLIEGKEQLSKTNKTKEDTRGDFVSAIIDHGANPNNAQYEYMVMLKPTETEHKRWEKNPGYKVIQANNIAHIVYDSITNVTAYACFEKTTLQNNFVKSVTAETLLMTQQLDENNLVMSVCDPSLRLPEKTQNSGNTYIPGRTTVRQVEINGNWQLKDASSNIQVDNSTSDKTKISVTCQLGLPVEFELAKVGTSVDLTEGDNIKIFTHGNSVYINGTTSSVALYDISGKELATKNLVSDEKSFSIEQKGVYVLLVKLPNSSTLFRKFIL